MQRLLLLRWHMFLQLPRQRPSWYRERLREELLECREALTFLQKLSETAGYSVQCLQATVLYHFWVEQAHRSLVSKFVFASLPLDQ